MVWRLLIEPFRFKIVEVIHQGEANVSKKVLQAKLATMYKAKDEKQVVVFGLKNAFGGGRSTGFALVYDSIEALKAFEPKHRLLRVCITS